MCSSVINYWIYCILVVAPIYKDSPLALFMGSAGYTIIPLLCAIFLCWSLITGKKLHSNAIVNKLLFLCFWIFFVGIVANNIWLFLGQPDYVLNENIYVKHFKVCLQSFVFPVYIVLLITYSKNLSVKKIFLPVIFTSCLLGLVCLFEQFQIPNAMRPMHFSGAFPYYRTRLLTLESSWTTTLVLNYSLLGVYYGLYVQRKKIIFLNAFLFVFLSLFSQAKSLSLSLVIFFLFYVVLEMKKLTKKKIVFILLTVLLVFFYINMASEYVIRSFQNDVENYTSVATRFYTICVGFIIGLKYPIGIGGGLYLPILQESMKNFLPWLQGLNLNANEIFLIVNSTSGHAVTVKSGLFQYNMYYGFLGTVFFTYLMKKFISFVKKSSIAHKNFLAALLIVNFILIATSSDFSFEFWLLVGIVVILKEKNSGAVGNGRMYA